MNKTFNATTNAKPTSGNGSRTTPAALLRSILFSGITASCSSSSRSSKKRALPDTPTCRAMSTPDEDQVASFDHDVARAVRNNDLDQLREYLNDGRCFTGCNRNGESLLHLACRRSHADVVEFLLDEAGLSVADYRDTLGRSCLHDCAWRPVPDWQLADRLLLRGGGAVSPWMLLEPDCRGHTCLDYVRARDHDAWNAYLLQSRAQLQRRAALTAGLLLLCPAVAC